MSDETALQVAIRERLSRIKKISEIDKGGFKIVYKVELHDDTVEALKAVQLPPLGDENNQNGFYAEAVGRVKREIGILQKCSVPELVRLGSISPMEIQASGADYIIYSEEFLDGADLWHEITCSSAIPDEAELRYLFLSLLRAIKEMWAFGYVHRDIKPKNIMKLSDPRRSFVLLDLGIAFGVRETALTYNPGIRLPPATYRYMAPEMASPDFRDTLDYRSDLYAAALTVYEYGAKHHPLARDGEDAMTTISRAIRIPARPFKEHRSDLSDRFCQMIDQMLKKKPGLRPANLNTLMQEMERHT